ncbi:MAG TPA: FKBP-type peptidyl-prolyl cis-trans isomerase [Candidatus Saccharimonadales bacterium]|nr:FKBP-type peptidyl-prolyl cis-trans isomerase [Candidatus Saccharimonadales bacterium]
MEYKTKKSTRAIILIIVFVMTVGFVGSYFIMIINQDQNKDPQTQALEKASADAQKKQKIDPTAFKVEGKVDKLTITDSKVGTGPAVQPGDTVQVHYKGTIAQTGAKFDSSYENGEPISFSLAQVIPGWQQGIPGMQVGGQRRLVIPAALAYGTEGSIGIPPNTDLVFEVELLAINPTE